MKLNFEDDILYWSNNSITNLGFKPFGENNATSRLSEVFGILANKIPPTPRSIKLAKNFVCPRAYSIGFDQIINEIQTGADLSPRCSRQLQNKHIYFDKMRMDWNIHHLHLGHEKIKSGKNRGLVKGYKDILFIMVTEQVTYFIGIYNHTSWAKQSILHKVYDNWPFLLEPYRLKGVLGLSQDINDIERLSLRNNNVNVPIHLNNMVFIGSGGGITAAGTGSNDIRKADIIVNAAKEIKTWIDDSYSFLEKHLPELEKEHLHFDVSRFIFQRTYAAFASKSSKRIFIPSEDSHASLVHPEFIRNVDPYFESKRYSFPIDTTKLIIVDE